MSRSRKPEIFTIDTDQVQMAREIAETRLHEAHHDDYDHGVMVDHHTKQVLNQYEGRPDRLIQVHSTTVGQGPKVTSKAG